MSDMPSPVAIKSVDDDLPFFPKTTILSLSLILLFLTRSYSFPSHSLDRITRCLHHRCRHNNPRSWHLADRYHGRRREENDRRSGPNSLSQSSSSSSTSSCSSCSSVLTSAVLKIAYDGTHFNGWTAGNGHGNGRSKARRKDKQEQKQGQRRKQSKRSRTLQRKGGGGGFGGSVRTVENALRSCLFQLYGTAISDPNQIQLESCSRTDAGVHALALVCQFYCHRSLHLTTRPTATARRQDDPDRPDQSSFLPLPFDSDLSKLAFVLNRMLPPDVRVVSASPVPDLPSSPPSFPPATSFHPTVHAATKTYVYKFALGPIHDPLRCSTVWHLDGSSHRAVGMNYNRFRFSLASHAAALFPLRRPTNYAAFQSKFRGSRRSRESQAQKQRSTVCTISQCHLIQEREESLPAWERLARQSSFAPQTAKDIHLNANQLNHHDIDNTYNHIHNNSSLRPTCSINPETPAMQNEPNNFNNPNTKISDTTLSSSCSESPTTFSIIITGDRFLYKMVRNIVGSIIAVGCGHLQLDDVRTALNTGKWDDNTTTLCGIDDTNKQIKTNNTNNSKHAKHTVGSHNDDEILLLPDRTIRRICAPARGLTLYEVNYPKNIVFDWTTG